MIAYKEYLKIEMAYKESLNIAIYLRYNLFELSRTWCIKWKLRDRVNELKAYYKLGIYCIPFANKYTPQAAPYAYVVYQTEKHEHDAGHNGDSDAGRQTPLQLLSLSSMLVAAAGDGDDYGNG